MMMQGIRGCIFDLDGTLLNTLDALGKTISLTMARFGYGPIDEPHVKRFVGDGYKKLVERALLYSGDAALAHYEEGLTAYTELFAVHSLYRVRPYEGIPELLDGMRRRGLAMAVLSNKPHAQTVKNIESIFGRDCFAMIAGEQPGIPKKPDPAGVVRILSALGISPAQCLYVGDTDTDMRTGLGAGLVTVGAAWGFRGREELAAFRPAAVCDRPEEILGLLS